jgi:hypothetical protein
MRRASLLLSKPSQEQSKRKQLARYRPLLESLEDRLVPATVDLGLLRFFGESLKSSDEHIFVADSGMVQLGFKPEGQAAFIPLVQIVVQDEEHSGKLTFDTRDVSQFKLEDASLLSIVQGGSGTKLWSSPNANDEIAFKIDELLSPKGMALNDTNSATVEVAGLSFKTKSLGFAKPTAGPTAFYTFEDVSVPQVRDSAGNQTTHDGLLHSASVSTTASLGIAVRPHAEHDNHVLVMNGNGQFMNVNNSDDLQPGKDAFTVSTWMYINPSDNREQIIAGSRNQTGARDGWEFGVTSGVSKKLFVRFGERNDESQGLSVVGSMNINVSGWYHVAFIYDGSNSTNAVTLYVGGVRDANPEVNSSLSLDPDISSGVAVTFNAGNPGSSTATPSSFHGYLDDLVVWNGILNTSQVNNLANGELEPLEVKAALPGEDRIQLQGTVNFANVHSFLHSFSVNVTGLDYVVYDHSGVSLTGLTGEFDAPAAEFANFDLTGKIKVGYSAARKTFTFSGGVFISSKPESILDPTRAFDKVGASLELVITDLKIVRLGFGLEGSFNIKGLTVETNASNPPSFVYNFDDNAQRWEIWGGLQVKFRDAFKIGAVFGTEDAPGLIIKDGKLESLTASVLADISIFGATLNIPAPGLTIHYDPEHAVYSMYGGPVTLRAQIGGNPEDIEIHFGTQDEPGLKFEKGVLKELNLGLTGDINIGPIGIHPENANVKWLHDEVSSKDKFIVSGGVTFDLAKFKAGVTFGNESQPGIIIEDGHFELHDIKVILEDVQLGLFEFKKLEVHFTQQEPNSDFDLDINLHIAFPGGWEVGGYIDVVHGKLDAVHVFYDAGHSNGIAVGDTGLFLTHIEATVKNIEHPSNIVVSGGIDVVFGEEIAFAGHSAVIFRAHGDFTVDKDEMILHGDAEMGAYQKDDGTWANVMGGGTMTVDLNWSTGEYQAHLEVSGLGGFFTFDADFMFSQGKDIRILAEGFVEIPEVVPIIGGTKIGGVGIYFEHVFPHDNVQSTTIFAAWLELDIFVKFDIGFEALWDATHNGSVSLIGTGKVDQFKAPPGKTGNTYTYKSTYKKSDLPSSATAMNLGVDWSKADPNVQIVGIPVIKIQRASDKKIFTEAEFTAANNLALLTDPQFVKPSTKSVHLVGSTSDPFKPVDDEYTLIVEITTSGGNPFPNPSDVLFHGTYHIPKPTLEPLTVPAKPQSTFPVTLTGRTDPAFVDQSEASIYLVLADDPAQTGRLVGKSKITLQPGTTTWTADIDVPLEGLYPTQYSLYAVLHQTPAANSSDYKPSVVRSANSSNFEPVFAITGSVANQNSHPQSGWTVFVDLNRNGVHEPNEPQRQTNDQGFYSFVGSVVPVNQSFDIVLVPLAEDFVLTNSPLANVTYNGRDTLTAPFQVKEKSAIRGTVFADAKGNGTDFGPGQSNIVVYLDANKNGQRDPGEETATTGPAGEYLFSKRSTGTYTVALDLKHPIATSFVVPAGLQGNQAWQHPLGMTFDVHEAIDITSLGIFDSLGDGFHGTLTATLYDRITQTAVAKVTFTASDPGTLEGGSRFKTLSQSITLYSGFQGMIVADGFTTADPNGNMGEAPLVGKPFPWTTNAGNGQLTFLEGYFSSSGHSMPNNRDPISPNPYAAGTFQYRALQLAQTSPKNPATYTITIDDSGFDLKDDNDFGILPLSTIEGTVLAQSRNGGNLMPATPQAGVTVQLLQNNTVMGTVVTGKDGQYSFKDIRPGAYGVAQVVQSGFRQVSPQNTLQLQGPNEQNTKDWFGWPGSAVIDDFNRNGTPDYAILDLSYGQQTPVVSLVMDGDLQYWQNLNAGFDSSYNPVVQVVRANNPEYSSLWALYYNGQLTYLPNDNNTLGNGTLAHTLPAPSGISNGGYQLLASGVFFENVLYRNQAQVAAIYSNGTQFIAAFPQEGWNNYSWSTVQSGNPGNVATGDINGDGVNELFVVTNGSPVLITPKETKAITSLPAGVWSVVRDINGDGRQDLGVCDAQGVFHFALQDASGQFPQAISKSFGSDIGQFKFALLQDLNGDFLPDLAWTSLTAGGTVGTLQVALNTGNANDWFAAPTQVLLVSGVDRYTLQAFDGARNGFADLLVTGYNHQTPNNKPFLQFIKNQTILQANPLDAGELKPGEIKILANIVSAQEGLKVNHTLTMPATGGASDWTIRLNGDRLEVHDRVAGLLSSRLASELNSLTIIASDSRINQITLDLSLDHLYLPSGIHVQGSNKRQDTLRILMGSRSDNVSFEHGSATLNGLPVTWTNVDGLSVVTGAGDDTISLLGKPLDKGTINLNGGTGNDTYLLATRYSTINLTDTSGIDTIDFSDATHAVKVDLARSGGQRQLIGGNNQLSIHSVIENLTGSNYADMLKGNSSNNIIIGGAGNDTIWSGGAGRDILIGGLGSDLIRGGSGDDLLIGGTTFYDNNKPALQAVMAEWVIGRDYQTRIKNIVNGSGSITRRNGNIFLNLSKVVDDRAVDTLFGGPGRDWFLAFPEDRTPDRNRQTERIG